MCTSKVSKPAGVQGVAHLDLRVDALLAQDRQLGRRGGTYGAARILARVERQVQVQARVVARPAASCSMSAQAGLSRWRAMRQLTSSQAWCSVAQRRR